MNNPLPRLPEFEYIRLNTVEKATQFLKDHPGEAVPFLGGTDLFVGLRDRRKRPKYLVDLKRLKELDALHFDPVEGLTVGANITLNQLIHHPDVQQNYSLLYQAAKQVGGYQLRNRATLCGNICNASPCGDTIGPCMAYMGRVSIIGPDGRRTLPLEDFFRGPGKVGLEVGEIVSAITLPPPPEGNQGIYLPHGRNKLSDLAIAAVTVLSYPDPASPSGFRFRIALSAVAPTVVIVEEAQVLLTDNAIQPSIFGQAAQIAMQSCKPIDDIRASAKFRRELIHTLTLRALIKVWDLLQS